MTTKKPLVVIKRKKKTLKVQKNSGNMDPLKEKELKIEDIKAEIMTALGQTADLKIDDIKIAETDGMLFFLESTIETALLKETFINKKMYQTKPEFDLTTKEGLTEFCQQEFGGSGFQLVHNG